VTPSPESPTAPSSTSPGPTEPDQNRSPAEPKKATGLETKAGQAPRDGLDPIPAVSGGSVRWPDVLRALGSDDLRAVVLGAYRDAGWTPDDLRRSIGAKEALAVALEAGEAWTSRGRWRERAAMAALRGRLGVRAIATQNLAAGDAQVLTSVSSVRVSTHGRAFLVESRHGKSWQREHVAATFDEAVEHAARQAIEARFRSGHSRIPLSEQTALVWTGRRWELEVQRFRAKAKRTRRWPNIYRALCSGTRGGIAGQHAAPVRRALWDIHLETVAALRDAACMSPTRPDSGWALRTAEPPARRAGPHSQVGIARGAEGAPSVGGLASQGLQ
jgi:hypothetical protein